MSDIDRPPHNRIPQFYFSEYIFCLIILVFFCSSVPGVELDKKGLESITVPNEELFSLDSAQIDPKKALFNVAEARVKQGLWQEAMEYATELLSIAPDHIEVHGILGTVYALTGQKKSAEKELEILKRDKYEGFYLEMINCILKAQEGNFKSAEQYLSSALKYKPGHRFAVSYGGSISLSQNKLNDAEKAFNRIIASDPDFTAALAGLGQVSLRRKNIKKAIDYYKRAVESDPENLIYRRTLIDLYNQSGQKEEANTQIKETLYYTPGVKQNYLRTGMQLLIKGSYSEAIDLMDKIINIYKDIPEALYIKAASKINLKQTKGVDDIIREYVSRRSWSARAHHYAGMCYMAMGEYDKAETRFKSVISINPEMGRSFIPLVIIEQIKGNYQRALEGLKLARSGGEPSLLIDYLYAHTLLGQGESSEYVKVLKLASGLIPGLNKDRKFIIPEKKVTNFAEKRNLLILFFLNSWYGKTVEICESLIESNSEDLFAWYYKAMSESAQNRHDESIKSFAEILNMEPELIAAHMGIGKSYMENGDYKNAAAAYNKVTDINPSYAPAYVELGDTLMKDEDYVGAEKSYRRALEINPDIYSIYVRLVMILADKKNRDKLDEALRFAKKAHELSPDDPQSMDALGWVLLKKGDLKKALINLKEASKKLPQDPLVKYHLGVALYKNKEFKKARRELQQAINVSNNFYGYKHAEDILKKLSEEK